MPETPKQATQPATCDLDEDMGKGMGSCRVCWEYEEISALLSPCKCKGRYLLP